MVKSAENLSVFRAMRVSDHVGELQSCRKNITLFRKCVFLGLPKRLQSAQKILQLINEGDSDLSGLSSDDEVEQPTTTSFSGSQPESDTESSGSSDDEPLCNIQRGDGGNTKWKYCSSFTPL